METWCCSLWKDNEVIASYVTSFNRVQQVLENHMSNGYKPIYSDITKYVLVNPHGYIIKYVKAGVPGE